MKLKRVLALIVVVVLLGGFGIYKFVAGGFYERWKLEKTMSDDYRYKDYVERGEELNAIISKVQEWELNLVDKSLNGGNFTMHSKGDVKGLGIFKDVKGIKGAPVDLQVDITYFYDVANNRALQHVRVNSEEKKLHKNTTVVYDKDGMELITYD